MPNNFISGTEPLLGVDISILPLSVAMALKSLSTLTTMLDVLSISTVATNTGTSIVFFGLITKLKARGFFTSLLSCVRVHL